MNGFIAQLASRVRAIGFGLRVALLISSKLICTIMGYIMPNRRIAMGIETWATSNLARISEICGNTLPRTVQAPIPKATHRVRYLSHIPSLLSSMISSCYIRDLSV